jgi:transcription initiation factor TFIIE subunit alpha
MEVAGKQTELLMDFLDAKKYMNEFLIAKKLDIPINQTRNILYKLSEFGLVSSTRKKDKKKGWFTYSWKIEELKSLEFLKHMIIKKTEQIRNQINSRETREFYVCERCHVEFNEENALLHDFTCPECGSILERKDNAKLIKELRKNLENYGNILKIVDEEVTKEQAAESKKVRIKDAAIKRTKAKERAAAREKEKIRKKKGLRGLIPRLIKIRKRNNYEYFQFSKKKKFAWQFKDKHYPDTG